MTSLGEYLVARRESRQLAASSPDPEADRAVAASEDRIVQAAAACYADGFTSEQLADAEDNDRAVR